MRTILHWMFNTVFLGIAVFTLIVVFGPRFSKFELLTVLSPSMSPRIPMGSVVVVSTEGIEEIQVGEIITFQSMEITDEKVTHRVVEVLEQGSNTFFRTQGDANNAPDLDLVLSNQVEGKVLFHFPLVGYVIQFIRTSVGFLMIIIIPALLVIAGEVRELLKLKRNGKRFAHAEDKVTER